VQCVTMRRDLSQVRCYRDGVRCNASMLTPSTRCGTLTPPQLAAGVRGGAYRAG